MSIQEVSIISCCISQISYIPIERGPYIALATVPLSGGYVVISSTFPASLLSGAVTFDSTTWNARSA